MVPQYLYHITNFENLFSILQTSLGYRAGKGINQELSCKELVYMIDFDPKTYLKTQSINDNRLDILLRICRLINYHHTFCKFVVIQIDTQQLNLNHLHQDLLDPYVWFYRGTIDQYKFSVYEMIEVQQLGFQIDIQDYQTKYDQTYFRLVL
jgi:hypothetical protein